MTTVARTSSREVLFRALVAALRVGLPAVLLAAGLYAGFRRTGPLPPLGAFLHPLDGVWATAVEKDLPPATLVLPSLTDSVRVVFDRRAVPHIFARNTLDAVRTLGYLHARFRLFQLEIQTRATNGTLTEWLGRDLLASDRAMRRLGLARSAEREFTALDTASQVGRLILAYAAGVNARLAELGSRDLPVEYHLLAQRPARWQPVHTLYLTKRMGYTLTYLADEWTFERVAAVVGPDAAAALLPVNHPLQEPIVPSPRAPRVDPLSVPPAETAGRHDGTTAAAHGPAVLPWRGAGEGAAAAGLGGGGAELPGAGQRWAEASNNWVVAPWRTADGHALLAGDPHLELSLPAIWFEVHLAVADTLDVYGVTLVGAPLVVIGFNRDVAWSFTNTGADVLDLYQEEPDHDSLPSRYRVDGAWRPLTSWVEEYRGPTGRVLATDTVYATHRGPLLRDAGRALSLRWTVLEDPAATDALWRAGQARSVVEWLSAIEAWRTPIQTGVVADRGGDIAVFAAGRYPVRPGGASGLVIRDGTTSASDWQGDLPVSRYPYARNPSQGFLASANQQPLDPVVDPVYLGANWPSPWRAMRINTLLRADSSVTPNEMRAFQTDPGSARADWFVPLFLQAVEREAAAERATADMRTAAVLLAQWDRRYTRDNTRAVLFEFAMRALADLTWDELRTGERGGRMFTPSSAMLAALTRDSASAWWDDRRTADVIETRDRVLAAGLAEGYRRAREQLGETDAVGWRWDRVRHQNIHHLLRLSGFSALAIPVQGGPDLLNPSSGLGTYGASWRMVVELGPAVRGWGAYPGGQSGNPMSPWYLDRLPKWREGELDPLPFPRAPDELPAADRLHAVVLTGGGRR